MPKQDHPKNIFWILIYIILGVAILLGLSWSYNLWRGGKAIMPVRLLSVNAEGKAVVPPDIASVSFSVVSEGPDPEKLTVENNRQMNAAIDFVKGEGIEDKDIKTAGYNLSPRYEFDEKRRKSFISGYTLTQTVFLKIRDFLKIGKILGGLPAYGINDIGSLSFDIENPDKYLNAARKEAFEKARAKAESMASQNGVKIKRVFNFSESPIFYPRPFAVGAFGKGGDFGGPSAPTIEPGSQEVTVQVSVTYEIR